MRHSEMLLGWNIRVEERLVMILISMLACVFIVVSCSGAQFGAIVTGLNWYQSWYRIGYGCSKIEPAHMLVYSIIKYVYNFLSLYMK